VNARACPPLRDLCVTDSELKHHILHRPCGDRDRDKMQLLPRETRTVSSDAINRLRISVGLTMSCASDIRRQMVSLPTLSTASVPNSIVVVIRIYKMAIKDHKLHTDEGILLKVMGLHGYLFIPLLHYITLYDWLTDSLVITTAARASSMAVYYVGLARSIRALSWQRRPASVGGSECLWHGMNRRPNDVIAWNIICLSIHDTSFMSCFSFVLLYCLSLSRYWFWQQHCPCVQMASRHTEHVRVCWPPVHRFTQNNVTLTQSVCTAHSIIIVTLTLAMCCLRCFTYCRSVDKQTSQNLFVFRSYCTCSNFCSQTLAPVNVLTLT